MTKFTEVPREVLHIAEELIAEFHPYLRDCNIGFVFRDEASTSGGKIVLAKTSKVPQNIRPLLQDEIDILVVIAEDQWALLSGEQRKALIDHELCHVTIGETGWKTQAHDIEEFKAIIERYGLWNRDLFGARTSIAQAVQLELSITGVEKTERGAVIAVDAEKWGKVAAEMGEAEQAAAVENG